MKIFCIADTHFSHDALVTEFDSRPPEFEKKIIRFCKSFIKEDDLLIHLGDVMVGSPDRWFEIIPEIPGRKILVVGNHDRKSYHWYMTNGFLFACESFEWAIYGLRILFTHEPVSKGNFDLNIHGHLHVNQHRESKEGNRSFLLSLEESNYQPQQLDSIIKKWQKTNNIKEI